MAQLTMLSAGKVRPPSAYKETISGPRLYVVNHIPERIPDQFPGLTQIYAGRAAQAAPQGAMTDLLADGHALPNERWSELSAIYKIWQEGPRSDVVGFCHYRRYFNFRNPNFAASYNVVERSRLANMGSDLFDLDLISSTGNGAAIVGREVFLNATVFDHYSKWCHASDFIEIFKLVTLHHNDISQCMNAHFIDRTSMYAANMFILRWPDFDELCRFWFGVLQKFVDLVSWPREDKFQNRDVGFLAERMFDAWIRYKHDAGLTLIELPVLFVS